MSVTGRKGIFLFEFSIKYQQKISRVGASEWTTISVVLSGFVIRSHTNGMSLMLLAFELGDCLGRSFLFQADTASGIIDLDRLTETGKVHERLGPGYAIAGYC